MPATVAFIMANGKEGFISWLGVVAIAGIVFAHLSMNLFDDYFDYRVKKSDFRDRMAHRGIRARVNKCSYLVSGNTTLSHLLTVSVLTGAIAVLAGAVIFYWRGIAVLYIAIPAILLGISYSGPPLRLSYIGLGEIVVGIMFGPLSMLGVYYSSCGHFDFKMLFISIPIGLLVANIIYVHSIMDCDPDREVGKATFAVLLGSYRRMLVAIAVLLAASYGLVIVGVIFFNLTPYYLLTLITLPNAIRLYQFMEEYVYHRDRQFKPAWWLGPFGNFEAMIEKGIDWFMIRWLTSRNLLALFCLVIVIVEFFN
jgi:1,4-dihydroxy-2-naphthoate octaprenyltransferase